MVVSVFVLLGWSVFEFVLFRGNTRSPFCTPEMRFQNKKKYIMCQVFLQIYVKYSEYIFFDLNKIHAKLT